MSGEDEIEVILHTRRPDGYDPADYALDPVGADAVLHGLIGALHQGRFADDALAFVPTRITRLDLLHPGCALAAGRIHLRRRGDRSLRADLTLFDAAGRLAARMDGVELRALRATQLVDLSRHAFGLETVPIDPPDLPQKVPAPWPAPEEIATQFGALSGEAPEAPEEAALLLDALAQRIAFDTLAAVDAASGGEAQGVAAKTLREGLSYLLAPLDLTRQTLGQDEELECDLPDAAALIAGISAEYPALIAECTALAHLAEALPRWLATGLPESEEAGFGRATLDGLEGGSVVTEARAHLFAEALGALLAARPRRAGRPLCLVELCDGPPRLLPHLQSGADGAAWTAWALEEGRAALLPPALGDGIGRVGPAHLAEIGPVDLVLGCGSAMTPVTWSTRLAALRPALRPAGAVILAEARPRPHLALLRLLGEALAEEASDRPRPPKLQEAPGLEEAARAAGFEETWAQSCAGACGLTMLIARTPDRGATDGDAPMAPDAQRAEGTGLQETLRAALAERSCHRRRRRSPCWSWPGRRVQAPWCCLRRSRSRRDRNALARPCSRRACWRCRPDCAAKRPGAPGTSGSSARAARGPEASPRRIRTRRRSGR